MNKKIKLLITACVLILFCLLVASCRGNNIIDKTYEQYDKEGYTISVKFDANGSYFGSQGNNSATDTFKFSDLKENENGQKEVPVIDPESEFRVSENRLKLEKAAVTGYFFAGWYTNKEAVLDQDGKAVLDDKGNPQYKYSGSWDFSKPFLIDATPETPYTSKVPVVTLYAAWVRNPVVNIYDKVNGVDTLIGTYEITGANYEGRNIITMPGLNDKGTKYELGTLSSAQFLKNGDGVEYSLDLSKFTKDEVGIITSTVFFDGFCLDEARNEKIEGKTYTHPYVYDVETATMHNQALNLYVTSSEKNGEWYRIYTADEFNKEAKKDSCLVIMNDLDFTKTAWPNALRNGAFEGVIEGNGHKITNVSINSTSSGCGLFKSITEDAVIKDISFDGITATIKAVSTKPGGRYALLAGIIDDGFKFENVSIKNATLKICASASSIVTADYEVGLLTAQGYSSELGIDWSIGYEAVTEEIDTFNLVITIDADHNRLLLEFTPKESN